MKIGIDASSASTKEWGGLENYSYNIIRALGKVDQSNDYVLFTPGPFARPLEEVPNFELKVLNFPLAWLQMRLSLETFASDMDLLFTPVRAMPFIRRRSLRTVLTVHDLSVELYRDQYKFPNRNYLKWYTKYSAKKADNLIAVSEATKWDLQDLYNIPEEKITVIAEGYDKHLYRIYDNTRTERVLRKHSLAEPFVLFVGTIQPRKNIVRLIEAFANLSKKRGDLSLVLAGKRGWNCEEIYEAPEWFGVSDRVKFLNHVADEDLPLLLNRAEVLTFPSIYEGFGLVILEAMACGTPVITSNVSSLPETGGDAAVLIDPYNVEELSQAIHRVIADNSYRDDLILRGLELVKRYSWEKAAKETIKVFEETAAR